LCKRQWRNQSADQSNDCSFHSDASFCLVYVHTFVTQSSSGRSFGVNLFIRLILRVSEFLPLHRFECASRIR
jgi:hypothetical protein